MIWILKDSKSSRKTKARSEKKMQRLRARQALPMEKLDLGRLRGDFTFIPNLPSIIQ